MEQFESLTELAGKAATLLPELPHGDALELVDWAELVWSVARRLAETLGSELEGLAAAAPAMESDESMTGEQLLTLAALVWKLQHDNSSDVRSIPTEFGSWQGTRHGDCRGQRASLLRLRGPGTHRH